MPRFVNLSVLIPAMLLLSIGGQAAGPVDPAPRAVTVAPGLRLREARPIPTEFRGPERAVRALRTREARPLVMTTADFDEDGVPDIVCGYRWGRSGILTLHRGNVDSIYPNAPEAKERRAKGTFIDAPFLPEARTFETPGRPDFLGAGDFDADGHWDVVTASLEKSLLRWHRGDGKGGFGPAETIELPGKPTAFVTGEINRRDGLEDVVVGIDGPGGSEVLVFEAPEGALRRAPERLPLPAPATSLVLSQLDERFPLDLLVAAGNNLVLVRGRDRRLSVAEAGKSAAETAVVDRIRLPFAAASLASGRFGGDEVPGIAVLSRSGALFGVPRRSLLEAASKGWIGAATLVARIELETDDVRLLAARVSGIPGDDLVAVNRSARRIDALLPSETSLRNENAEGRVAPLSDGHVLTLAREAHPAAIVPMRLNPDGLSDFTVLDEDTTNLLVIPSGPDEVYTVTTTEDTDDGTCDAHCTLREAILAANANPLETVTIAFDIPGLAPYVIRPDPRLPQIHRSVVIDGTTEPDYKGSPVVVIDGSILSTIDEYPIGLEPVGGVSVIRGLSLVNFDSATTPTLGRGILGNALGVEACFIGLDPSGLAAPNDIGIELQRDISLIGGTAPAARNVISGNGWAGVVAAYWASASVQGNYIGLDPTGLLARPNGIGVQMDSDIDVLHHVVGSTVPGAGNVIASNAHNVIMGAHISGLTTIVQGNYIGTDPTGLTRLGESVIGISVWTDNALIGGTTPPARNVVAGTSSTGISVFGESNLIQGNYVGVDSHGAGAIPGSDEGVDFSSNSRNNQIGGTLPAARNVISGHVLAGVVIRGELNTVASNFIGTDVSGASAIPNGTGVTLEDNATTNVIGVASGGNVISGNLAEGVVIRGDTTAANFVSNNVIGLTADGASPLGNGSHGVRLESPANVVGGTEVAYQNVIASNGGNGILVSGPAAVDNALLVNAIFDNGNLGIDLSPLGVNINDTPLDPDEGANHGQNYPEITLAQWNGETVRVDGTLDSLPLSDFTIRVYVSETCDPSGYGEGKFYLGSLTVTTDAAGQVAFSRTFSGPTAWGEAITATANHLGDTSEFSPCKPVVGTAPDVVDHVHFDSARPERLVWDAEPGASLYNLYIGTVSTIPGVVSPISDSCQAAAIPETGGTLPPGSNPPPGQMIWFMVTASNQFGEGELQPATQGPRQLNSTGFCGESCAHDMCSTGGALVPACTLCASIVCTKDPHCCAQPNGIWDLQCVQQVRTVCRSLQCAESQGQCPHSLCDPSGGPLPPGCDTPPLAVSCTAAVCQADPHCCQQAWDEACIAKMETVCGHSCI